MPSVVKRLERFGQLAENAALVILLGSLVVIAVSQIILREVFQTGFVWADGLVKFIVLWLAMVGSIAATRNNRHIRIDVVSHLLPRPLVRASRILVDIFAAGVTAVIAWQSWRYLNIEVEYEMTVLQDVPAWIAHIIVPVAFLLISYRFIVLALKQAIGAHTDTTR